MSGNAQVGEDRQAAGLAYSREPRSLRGLLGRVHYRALFPNPNFAAASLDDFFLMWEISPVGVAGGKPVAKRESFSGLALRLSCEAHAKSGRRRLQQVALS